jgi:4-amino-4-deoxy-L-arabinose transferase-like glycosyltransferase
LRFRTIKLLLLAAITLLAAFLRLYRIDSLPPSDGYDQATYGLDVLDILAGARPIFLPSNFGREALYSYLVTLCALIIGNIAIAVYATSAVIGTLTVPAVYLAAEELFAGETGPQARWGSLLAALAMAILHWHLSWSRLGMRAILVPLFAATTTYLFWRGVRTGRRWTFVACGVSLGLSLHSYQAARALPLLILLGFAYVAIQRAFTKSDLVNLLLVFVAALIVFAPLGIYFLTHPGSAGLRVGQAIVVNQEQDTRSNVQILRDQLFKTLLAFGIHGDEDARVTLPGRPMLDPFLALAFALGLVASVCRFKQARSLYLLTWLAGLTAPAVLAQYGPTSKRAIGATPAVAILIAVGCLTAWQTVRTWAARRHPSWARRLGAGLAALIALGLVYSGVRTYRDYFILWPQDPNLFTHFETGQSAIGAYIKERPPEERIYLSPVPADHHSVVLNSGRRPGVKSYQGKFCTVVVDGASQDTTYIIVPADDETSLGRLQDALPQGWFAEEGPLHYQLPYFVTYRVPAGARAQIRPAYPLDIRWGDQIQLLGFDLDRPAYRPGDTILLTLYYRRLNEIDVDYTVFTHLLGPDNPTTGGPVWAQKDSEPCQRSYPTSAWGEAEIVIDSFKLALPTDAPPGKYQIEAGFYQWPSLQRLPVVDTSGQVVADHAILSQLTVIAPE